MGFKQFDKLLHKLNAIEGKLLGPKFDVYRIPSTGYLDWKTNANKIDTLDASFTMDNKYQKNPTWSVPLMRVGVDGQNLLPGDVLVNDELGRTYFLIERDVNHPFQAIQATSSITVNTVTSTDWGSTGEFRPPTASVDTNVGVNIPACVIVGGNSEIDGGFVPARTARKASVGEYELYFWMPEGSVTEQSTFTYGSVEITTDQVFWSPAGYKVLGTRKA